MSLQLAHVVGIVAVLALVTLAGVWSGRRVSSAADFTTGGGRAGALVVTGSIMGTLVSGQATIGTAQLAFSYGLSAWWFTLGSGVGCLVLALAYVTRLRASGRTTLVGVIVDEYGERIERVASVFSAVGIFISVVAQLIAASALLTTLAPLSREAAVLVSIALMTAYVVFGGVWGTGVGGVIKLVLLYAAALVGGAVVLVRAGGLGGLWEQVATMLVGTGVGEACGISSRADLAPRFLSLVARGPFRDLGSGLSLVLGVISTQSYASAVWSARSDADARRGALASALLIPPIGLACIMVGLFMRGCCLTADEVAALSAAGASLPGGLLQIGATSQVFPQFALNYLPPLFGGVVLGTLFVTVVGGGSGLSLGVATIVVEDLLEPVTSRWEDAARKLLLSRCVVVAVLSCAGLVALVLPDAMINDFGFLSMGLRGTVIFVPLTFALFARGRIEGRWALVSAVLGPVCVVAGNLLGLPFDPLFAGVLASALVMWHGLAVGRQSPAQT